MTIFGRMYTKFLQIVLSEISHTQPSIAFLAKLTNVLSLNSKKNITFFISIEACHTFYQPFWWQKRSSSFKECQQQKTCVLWPYLDKCPRKFNFFLHEPMTCKNINKRGTTNNRSLEAIKVTFENKIRSKCKQ